MTLAIESAAVTERRQIAGVGMMFVAVLLFAITMAMWQAASTDAAYEREVRAYNGLAVDGADVEADRGPALILGAVALALFFGGIAILYLGATPDDERPRWSRTREPEPY
jgi:hypothetical protein